MRLQNYQCCNCFGTFNDKYYNWYAYYNKGNFHKCPQCESELVASYDFEKTGLLDKITMSLFIVAVVTGLSVNHFFDSDNAGVLAFVIPAVAGGITHMIYWSSLVGVDREIQETRIRPKK